MDCQAGGSPDMSAYTAAKHALEGLSVSLAAELTPLGVQLTKRALQVNADAAGLAAALELENRNQVLTHATEEAAARRQSWSS